MDGFQFIEAVQSTGAWRAIPIIVLTAKQLSAEEQKLLQGSVTSIIRKGQLSKDELFELIGAAISSLPEPGEESDGR
jgi:CheY-like chemotaxis protein